MTERTYKPLKCLSIAAPWPWAIFYEDPTGELLGKDVENRTWRTTAPIGPLLIHCSLSRRYRQHVDWIRSESGLPCPDFDEHVRGAIIGIVEHVGCWHFSNMAAAPVKDHDSPFIEGPWCHVLRHQTQFAEPVLNKDGSAYKGQRGLFDVPLEHVRKQLEKLPEDRRQVFRELYRKWEEVA